MLCLQKSPSGSEVSNTKDPRKSGFSLGKLFRKKKDRSQSESALHQEEEALRRKQKVIRKKIIKHIVILCLVILRHICV